MAKTDSGRETKFYSLTAKGKTQLQQETEGCLRLADAVSLILKLQNEEVG